jgi:hypothetical protein
MRKKRGDLHFRLNVARLSFHVKGQVFILDIKTASRDGRLSRCRPLEDITRTK